MFCPRRFSLSTSVFGSSRAHTHCEAQRSANISSCRLQTYTDHCWIAKQSWQCRRNVIFFCQQYSYSWQHRLHLEEAQLSQRGRAMLRVIEYYFRCHSRCLKVIANDILSMGMCKSLLVFHCNGLHLVPFLRYSASNNGVTLKCGLGVIQGNEIVR